MFRTFSRVNSFPAKAKGKYIRPFGVIRWKLLQKSEKILCDLVERWRVGKLKSSAFQNANGRKMHNYLSKTTTLSNLLAINFDALHSELYRASQYWAQRKT